MVAERLINNWILCLTSHYATKYLDYSSVHYKSSYLCLSFYLEAAHRIDAHTCAVSTSTRAIFYYVCHKQPANQFVSINPSIYHYGIWWFFVYCRCSSITHSFMSCFFLSIHIDCASLCIYSIFLCLFQNNN